MIRFMATTTLMSFAEFERLDCDAGQLELLKGELIQIPPAQNSHLNTSERLYDLLKTGVEGLRESLPNRQFGRVHMERGYYFSGNPGSWLQPDVSLTHPGQPVDRYYLGAPLIAFEIVSEDDRATDLDRKVSVYLTHGAAEVWLIYPTQRHALAFDGSGVRNEIHSFHTDLLPGVEIPLDRIL